MAAEIARVHFRHALGGPASMRPRRMAAEIGIGPLPPGAAPACFNEAAANGRGNLAAVAAADAAATASMRPRRMAAEIRSSRGSSPRLEPSLQ